MSFFLILIIIKAFSQENKPFEINLEEALSAGVKNCSLLKMENINLENAKLNVASSYNNFAPEMGFKTGLVKYNDDPDVYLKLNFNLFLSVNASSIFSIYETVIDMKEGKIKQDAARKQIKNNIKKSYYSLLFLSEQIELTKEYLAGVEKRFEITKKMFEEGISPKINFMKSQYSRDMVKINLKTMDLNYKKALLEFTTLIGIKNDNGIILKDKLEITRDESSDFEAILNNKLSENYELKTILNSIEKLSNKKNYHIGALTPSLELYYNYSLGFSQNVTDNIFSGDNYLSLSVSLPLDKFLPLSKTQLEIIQTQNKIKGLNEVYKEKYEEIKIRIRNVIEAIERNREITTLLKEDILMSEEILNLSNKLYEVGSKSLYEVESHHKDFVDTKSRYLNLVYNYKIDVANLQYILNLEP